MELNTNESSAQFIELATDIVSAYVSNNSVGAGELPVLIKDVYGALTRVSQSGSPFAGDEREARRLDQEVDHAGLHHLP